MRRDDREEHYVATGMRAPGHWFRSIPNPEVISLNGASI